MIIRMPVPEDIPQMKQLWQQTFQDPIECIDAFFTTGYRQDHSRILWDGEVLGAVYWFDLYWQGGRYGLVYALAVAESRRGRGLGNCLMDQVCRHLQSQDYTGAVLVPAGEHLYGFYRKLGFAHFGGADTVQIKASGQPVYLVKTSITEYLDDRPGFSWGDAFCAFVENQCVLYRAGDMRLICYKDGADIQEYIGPAERLPGVLAGLGLEQARVRMGGTKEPAGMYRLFKDAAQLPDYFGPILD